MEWSDDKLLTAKELKAHLDLRDSAFREKLRAKQLPPPIRVGGTARWRWGAVKRWIEAVETVQTMSPGLLQGVSKSDEKAVPTAEDRRSSAEPENPPPGRPKRV